jgi:PAS domain S-box-containing protein
VVRSETGASNKSGDNLDLHITVDVIQDNQEINIAYSLIIRDITEEKRSIEHVEYMNNLLKSVNDISQSIAEESDLDALMQRCCDTLLDSRHYLDISIALLDVNRNRIYPVSHSGEHERLQWQVSLEGEGDAPRCVQSVLKSRSEHIVDNPDQYCSGCEFCTHEKGHQTIVIPMLYQNIPVGVLSVCFREQHEMLVDEAKLLEEVTKDLSIARANILSREALELSEARYALSEVASGVASWDWDLRKGRVFWSETIEPLFGYEPGELPGVYKSFIDVVYPEDQERVQKAINECIEEKKKYDIEHRIVRKDGKVRWVEATGDVILDQNKEPVRLVGIVQDITEWKEKDQELKHERRVIKSIMENTNAMLAYLDNDFNFVYVNEAYASGSGHTEDELIGKNHFELFPDRENQAIFERVRDTGETVKYKDKAFEFPDQPGRGTTYWDWTLAPVCDNEGEVQGLVLSVVETTERKEMEKRIKMVNEKLEYLLKSSPAIIYSARTSKEEDYGATYLSSNVSEIVGFESQDFVDDPGFWLEHVHPGDRDWVLDEVSKVFKKGHHTYEYRFQTRDGKYLWIRDSMRLVRDENGEPIEIVGFWEDITEQKEIEDSDPSRANKIS